MPSDDVDVNPASSVSERVYEPSRVERDEHAEGTLTRVIEHQTAKIPSHVFLAAALAAMATSLGLELAGRRRISRFIGMWPASLLTMGVYNKMLKLVGSR